MSRHDSNKATGFALYTQKRDGKGFLLPTSVIQTIEAEAAAEAKADAEAMAAQAAAEEADREPKPVRMPLPKIETHADATAFAEKLLADVIPPVLLDAQFSKNLLAAVLMQIKKEGEGIEIEQGMDAVFGYLTDPDWDSARQMFCSLQSIEPFLKDFEAVIAPTPTGSNGELAQAARTHWERALSLGFANPERPADTTKPARTVPVFCIEAMAKAATAIREVSSDKSGAAVRILEQARAQDGQRALPDAAQASQNLDAKKLDFENLRAPIERLQTDLVLAQAMPAQEFRIAPILLLGEPGIGKTYLASQLAQALDVPSAKMSAGGAQGAFQLAGSHSTWASAKPGMVIELLAQSASASPVLVIDEVDKIHEDKYAFLPVLLDLLDAGTAKQFRDEYFEMTFDASRIVFVLTANSIDKVPPPLLSRVEVFRVPAPEPAQRLRIIQKIMTDLAGKTGHPIAFAPGIAERMADLMHVDLRQLDRMARAAFAVALQAGDEFAKLPHPIDQAAICLHTWTPEPERLSS